MLLDADQYATHEEIRTLIDRALAEDEGGDALGSEWNLPIEHWSPSSLGMLVRCPIPRQWQERYIHGRKARPAEAPVLGTSVHAAFERNFEQKITSHEDLPTPVLLEWYMDEGFARTVVREEEKSGEEVTWDTSPDDTRRRGYQIVAAYQDLVAPRVQPLRVETRFSVDLGAPVPVEGIFDVEREQTTIDYKSGKRVRKTPDESWRLQGGVYMEATGKPTEFHSLSATTTSNAVTIVTPLESEALLVAPNEFEREQMRQVIRALSWEACMYMAKLGPDEPWPTKGKWHAWACSYCGYRNDCPAWRTE